MKTLSAAVPGAACMPIEQFSIAGRCFSLELPDQEEFLSEAVAGEFSGAVGWDPYWGMIWAAAPITARLLLQAAPRAESSLELGCGVGLTGLAALAAAIPVTFSDQSDAAVRMACRNAERNGLSGFDSAVFSWSAPPERRWDFLFGSDILYDAAAHDALLTTLRRTLLPGGCIWIGDEGRGNSDVFVERARDTGWRVRLLNDRLRPLQADRGRQFRLLLMDAADSFLLGGEGGHSQG